MKGKRKAKNTKWALKQNIQNDARSMLAKRSPKAVRFLDAISMTVIENKPAGLLARLIRSNN